MSDHANTSVLITGGSQGLGYAVAERLIIEGCRKVVIVGRDAEKGAQSARTLTTLGVDVNVHFIQADLSDVAQVDTLVDRAITILGELNALVNCAADTSRAPLFCVTAQLFDTSMAVNARAPLLLIQALAKRRMSSNNSTSPAWSVVNIGSNAAHCGPPHLAPYSASKAALICITKNMAHSLRGHIRVNAINVGWMDTPAEHEVQQAEGNGPDWLAKAESSQPFGSLVKPHQVARQISLFLSPNAGVVSGSIVDWDQHVIGVK